MMVAQLLDTISTLFFILLLARMVVSYLPQVNSSHPLVRFLDAVTEPILMPFRSIMPVTRIGLDFSPLLALITIQVVFGIIKRLVI